ncbi:hypothetical protein Tco_0786237 [Tanacetum coccineum]
MNDKMQDPECVKKKVKIAPHDYSKENYLATFTPQKQLTPEQIFWSNDLIKMKVEALKGQTIASRAIKVLTVYPPNKPTTLVPRRITPTGLAEGERGFEQTKECYLTEKCFILQQILSLLYLDSLKCMMPTVVQARCLELETELSKLRDKVQKDDHTELVKHFSNLEVNHLNLQIKYQNLKESFGNNTSPPARDAPDFDSVFVIEKMKASIQGKDNAIKKLRMQISQLNETRSEADRTLDFKALDFQITQLTKKVAVLQNKMSFLGLRMQKLSIIIRNYSVKPRVLAPGKYAIDVEPIPPLNRNNRKVHLGYLKHLKESVETLREIIEEAKVERPLDSSLAYAFLYTKHSQELLEYVIGTCLKDLNTRDKQHASTPLTRKKQVTFEDQCETSNNNTHKHVEQLNIPKTNVPVPPSTRVNRCTDASGSQPRSNTKKNKISPANSVNKKKVEEHPRTNKSSLKTTNHVDSSISSKRNIFSGLLFPPSDHLTLEDHHEIFSVDSPSETSSDTSFRHFIVFLRDILHKEPDVILIYKLDIDACIVIVIDIAARGTDVMLSADGFLEVMQRGLDVVMQELYDHMVEISVHRVRVIESVQRDHGHRIVVTSQQNTAMSERIDCDQELNRKAVEEAYKRMSYEEQETETKMENEQQDNNVEAIGNNGNGMKNGIATHVEQQRLLYSLLERVLPDFSECVAAELNREPKACVLLGMRSENTEMELWNLTVKVWSAGFDHLRLRRQIRFTLLEVASESFSWMVRLTDPPSAGSVPCYGGSVGGAGTAFVIL